MTDTAKLRLSVYNGARQPLRQDLKLLITLHDGNQKQIHRDFHYGPTIEFEVPFYNNLGDNYAVIAWADRYQQAGFVPVHVTPSVDQTVDIMLLPSQSAFDFAQATWSVLSETHPQLTGLLAHGAKSPDQAKSRYQELMDGQPAALACLLNLATVMANIDLPQGTPIDYLKELIWDGQSIRQDRFYAFCDKALVGQVKVAAGQGGFAKEPVPDFFHPGATSSYKQVQFGEANLQLTFHENDTANIDQIECVKIEPDIDYYKDALSHVLLEVLPNHFTGPTDPKVAYVLRWIAGRHAGVPEFDPPYTIVSAAA